MVTRVLTKLAGIGPVFRHMLLATLCFGAASGIFLSTLNNYLSDVHDLGAAARGQNVRVRNLDSKRVVSGRVTAPNTIEMEF